MAVIGISQDGITTLVTVDTRGFFPKGLGEVLITAGADKVVKDPLSLLKRHICGDWGENREQEDIDQNDEHARTIGFVMSEYDVGGQSVWVMTGADHSETTILLPDEY